MTTLLEIFILSLTISLDSFMSAFAYGACKIKIHFLSALLMSLTAIFMLFISCLAGDLFNNIASRDVIKYISFALLLCVGLFKLISEIFKSYVQFRARKNKPIKFSLFGKDIKFESVVDVSKTDKDNNKILSPIESLGLGFMLSIDSLGVGLSYGLENQVQWILFVVAFAFSIISILLGNFLGKKIAKKCKVNLSFLSGLVLIALSISKLFI